MWCTSCRAYTGVASPSKPKPMATDDFRPHRGSLGEATGRAVVDAAGRAVSEALQEYLRPILVLGKIAETISRVLGPVAPRPEAAPTPPVGD